MDTLSQELLALLRKNVSDEEVRRAIQQHGLDRVTEDPPFRRYVGSSEKGVDLLFDDDIVVDVQFHAMKSKGRSAFVGDLPLGLKGGMSQKAVHKLLGKPKFSDEFESRYFLKKYDAQLNVVYDRDGAVKYVSVGLKLP